MICPNCGQPVADGAGFCGSCGSPISAAPDAPDASSFVPSEPAPQVTNPTCAMPTGEGGYAGPGGYDPGSAYQSDYTQSSAGYDPQQGPASFCPNCGGRVQAGATFCPNCGAQLGASSPAQPPAPPRKKKTGRLVGIAAVIVAVLVIAVAAAKVVPAVFSSPADQFISYQQDLVVEQLLSGMETGLDALGSWEFSSDLTVTASVNNEEINRYLEGSSVGLKLGLTRDSLLADAQLNLMGSQVLSGTLTYDQGKVGFYLPQVDENYYVADLSDVVYNLSGMEMDLSALALPELSGSEWRSLAQSYLDLVYTVVTKDNVEKAKDVTFQLEQLGVSGEGTVYTFTPTAGDVEAMLLKLADKLEEDETLRSLVLDLINPAMLQTVFGEDIFGGYDPETELDSALLSAAQSIRADAAYIGQSVEESGFTWTLAVEGKQVRLIRIELGNYDAAFVYECDGEEDEGMNQIFYLTSAGQVDASVTNSYTRSDGRYTGRCTFYAPYSGAFSMGYDLDEETVSPLGLPYGTYDYTFEGEDMSFSMTVGDGASGGSDHTFTIQADSSYFGYLFDTVSLTINATEEGTAQVPSAAETDISSYTPQEYEQLFNRLGETLSADLINNLAPLMYGMYGW